ncbi:polysaccharide deacetylase family protein [Pedosphaera parvula]|uniref:Polysaccharide deacetylase n=1 Tax=Pedosphaera parvula (strain Ellin514) TaxID=320771 RepID=B9XSC7_PEDPL|nr:polysaccharide deacetylase family protein [Pedosphaera parvula]EEF57260.1 polysaccharide deacetylase [Pedosphaera parvula Ellin514]
MLDLFCSELFLGFAQRRLFERGLPVFTYHSIAAPSVGVKDPFLYVTPSRFSQQLETLAEAGFTSGTLDEVAQNRNNRGKKVVITFDDGYLNVLDNGLKILLQHKFRAIQFIVADLIGTRNEWDVKHGDIAEALMDVSQIREWLAAGQEIGSHSSTHRNLSKLNQVEAREQIFGSKKKLEDTFGIPIRHFCYPHGKWNPMIRDLVGEAGYVTACTTEFGVNTSATAKFELNRIFCLSEYEMMRKTRHRIMRKLTRK